MTTKTKKTAKKTATKAIALKRPAKAAKAKALTKAEADKITSSRAVTSGGDSHAVHAADGRMLIIPTARWAGDIRKLSAVGGSFTALEAAWAKQNVVKLAKGITSRDAPQAAKSVQDNAAKARATAPKAEKAAKPAKAAKAEKAKAAKPAAAKGSDRAYKVTGNLTGVREGTWRYFMLDTIMSHKSTKAAQEAADKARGEFRGRKLDFNWSARSGYIQFAD